MNKKEIYKDVIGYETLYKISNLGNVKSLDRLIKCPLNGNRLIKGRLLKSGDNGNGYLKVHLSKKGKVSKKYVHHLVAESFLGYKKKERTIVIDHIDNDRANNNVVNLQIITQRQNTIKDTINKTSDYRGVHFNSKLGQYEAKIYYNNKSHYLGVFNNNKDAHNAYVKELNKIT